MRAWPRLERQEQRLQLALDMGEAEKRRSERYSRWPGYIRADVIQAVPFVGACRRCTTLQIKTHDQMMIKISFDKDMLVEFYLGISCQHRIFKVVFI